MRRIDRSPISAAVLTAGVLAILAATDRPARADDVLVIGAPISKTGWAAPYDSPVMDGFAVAMDEINAKGGIAGRFKVEVLTRDNRSDNAQNAIVTRDLIDRGAKMLSAACASSMFRPTRQVYEH